MAPRRRRPPGSVLLWSQQVAPEYHREPVPRSRKTRSAHKAQSFAAGSDGFVDVSAHGTLRIMGAGIAAMVPSLLVVVLTLHEAGNIIGERFIYVHCKTASADNCGFSH